MGSLIIESDLKGDNTYWKAKVIQEGEEHLFIIIKVDNQYKVFPLAHAIHSYKIEKLKKEILKTVNNLKKDKE